MTDTLDNVVWTARLDAYGKVTNETGTVVNNLRFPGQYHDRETGLYQNWHRYYSPELGRYITSDPIGLEGGLNTYAYVGGDPVNAVDPEGLHGFLFARPPIVPRIPIPRVGETSAQYAARLARVHEAYYKTLKPEIRQPLPLPRTLIKPENTGLGRFAEFLSNLREVIDSLKGLDGLGSQSPIIIEPEQNYLFCPDKNIPDNSDKCPPGFLCA
jgi:RHS repeat-associated protein